MSKIIDGKTYYSSKEARGMIHNHIRENAEELKEEFNKVKLENKEEVYV